MSGSEAFQFAWENTEFADVTTTVIIFGVGMIGIFLVVRSIAFAKKMIGKFF